MKRQSQQGVALVITLILLSVITFMAVTFLVVSRHEGEQVNTTTQQTIAKFTADAITQQAEAQIMAIGLGQSNALGFGLIVSTNFISPFYDKNSRPLDLTNVSYYDPVGNYLTGNNYLQMLNNLLYLPRAPVFVSTNRTQVPEFRFYHDLNRNGIYDTNGPVVEMDVTNNISFQVTNTYVGDPEWVGILEHPDQRHSASNFFVARGAFIAVPIGNTLDINFIHNQAKLINPLNDGFLRNQGVGSWEINLAAFLRVLNPNEWGDTLLWGGTGYDYRPADAAWSVNPGSSVGTAFGDANGILQYRYNGGYNSLRSFRSLYTPTASFLFGNYYIDGYSGGPLMTNLAPLSAISQPIVSPWSGADNPKQFFSSQDFFSSSPYLSGFSNRLNHAGHFYNTNGPGPYLITNSFNRYTFYRMLAQMGFGSTPEAAPYPASRRMNLNYNNLGSNTTALVATNFVPWAPLMFFTNAANRLLANAGYTFTVTNIPIYPTNFYTPAVHRLLQLAANIYDASTNRAFSDGTFPDGPYAPSVFRPTFIRTATNVMINGYVEEGDHTFAYQSPPLTLPDDLSLVTTNTTNIYGAPWVIGAKKGFPNFNEIAMQSVSQVTRKLQIDKVTGGASRASWHTNQMYLVGISNLIALEAWNSYATNYPRGIDVIAADNLIVVMTNQFNYYVSNNIILAQTPLYIPGTGPLIAGNTNVWLGFRNTKVPATDAASFRIPLYTNFVFLPDSAYHQAPAGFSTNQNSFEQTWTTGFQIPHFVLSVTNRLRFIILDHATGRVIDYVQLNGMDSVDDLTAEVTQTDTGGAGEWDTNRVGGSLSLIIPPLGVVNQIQVALGNTPVSLTVWNNAQLAQYIDTSKQSAIDGFAAFYNNTGASTNVAVQVPFTPTRKFSKYFTWQANDPLVHYTLGDLNNAPRNGSFTLIVPPNPTSATGGTNFVLPNIQLVNDRYAPWGGNPRQQQGDSNAVNLTLKDPMVVNSDFWQFPTNKFPNIGWLGRVHRGTPWQTVYLKSSGVDSNTWQKWSGNSNIIDAAISQPTNDWKILDLFTTAPNDNASRGQLSINQTNLAAWAAVLDGVIVVSNTPTGLVPLVIDPTVHSNVFTNIIFAINSYRSNYPGGAFNSLGQILSVPQLTVASPFLNPAATNTLSDAVYERIPQQIMSLLRLGSPRYAIFAYGQSLKPADHSIVQSGPFFGMCTNYQITGEVLTRTIVRFDNTPTGQGQTSPRAVIEGFNILGPD